MPVMAVHNENQHEQTGEYRSRPRWSAGKKMEAVLRFNAVGLGWFPVW